MISTCVLVLLSYFPLFHCIWSAASVTVLYQKPMLGSSNSIADQSNYYTRCRIIYGPIRLNHKKIKYFYSKYNIPSASLYDTLHLSTLLPLQNYLCHMRSHFFYAFYCLLLQAREICFSV